jgi:hypothetical protein
MLTTVQFDATKTDLYSGLADKSSTLVSPDRPRLLRLLATVFVPGLMVTVLVFLEVASRCLRNEGFAFVEHI